MKPIKLFRRIKQTRVGWAAITLDVNGLRAVHVERVAGAPRLTAMFRADPGIADADAFAALAKAMRLDQHQCTTTIAQSAYQVIQIAAPSVPIEERNATLRWAIKDMVSFDIEDAIIDSMEIPADGSPAGRARLVLAVAAKPGPVAQQAALFQAAGIRLAAMDIAESAQRNLATLFESNQRTVVLLSFNAHGGLLTFSHRGELYAVRHIDTAIDVLVGELSAFGRDAIYDRIALELQRSLDIFDRLFSLLGVARLLLAPFPGHESLLAHLRINLPLAVEVADLREFLAVGDGIELGEPDQQASWFTPIGLALRDEGKATDAVLKLELELATGELT